MACQMNAGYADFLNQLYVRDQLQEWVHPQGYVAYKVYLAFETYWVEISVVSLPHFYGVLK